MTTWLSYRAACGLVVLGAAAVLVLVRCGPPSGISGIEGTVSAVAERFPVVAVDGRGHALILSRGREGDHPRNPVHVFASTHDFATGLLSPPTNLVTTAGAGDVERLSVVNHAIAMDESGDGVALWSTQRPGFSTGLHANQFERSAGWRRRVQLSDASVGNYRVAMDGFGRALAVWLEGDTLVSRDFFPSPMGGWHDARVVRAADGLRLGDVVYRAFDGAAIWREAVPPPLGGGVLSSRFSGNQGWGLAQNFWFSLISHSVEPPRMVLHRQAPSDSPIAVWQDDSGRILSAQWVEGGGWAVQQDGIPGSEGGIRPQVAMAANFESIALWSGPSGELVAARFVGGTWIETTAINSGAPYTSGSHRLAMDGVGNAIAVWWASDKVYANRYVRGQGWQQAQEIGAACISQPDLAMDDAGRAIVVWEGIDPADRSKTRLVRYVFGEFDLALGLDTLDLARNSEAATGVFLTRTGYNGDVALDVLNCPFGVLCTVSDNPIPGGVDETVLTMVATQIAQRGAFVITVRATGAGIVREATIELRVQ